MSLFQAVLCGIFYYLNAGPWVIGGGFYTFGKPMVLGFFVGLVLGDPVTGTIVGATIQLMYLGIMSTGGSYPADSALAGILGTSAAIIGGLSAAEAVTIALPIGLAGTVLYQLRMLSAVPFTHMADRFAEKGNTKMVWWANVGFPQIALALIYVVPCTLACYFGVDAIKAVVDSLSNTRVLPILSTIGGMLPVIGIAMNMKAIFKGDARLFLLVGFILVTYFKLDLIVVSILALIFAVLFIQLKGDAATKGEIE